MRLFFYLFIALNISTFLQAQTAGGDINKMAGGDIDITAGSDPSISGDVNISAGSAIMEGGSVNISSGSADNYSGLVNITTPFSYEGGNNINLTGGNGVNGGGAVIIKAGNVSDNFGSSVNITAGDGLDDGGYIFLNPGSGTPDGLVYVNGSGTYTGTWTFTSDKRFKKNINHLENGLNSVLQLRGVNYEFKTEEFPEKKFNKGKQIGLIAQEVEKVFPEFVTTDSEGYKSVAYQNLVAVLIEAIKEQQKQMENLSQKIETLEKEITGEVVEVSSLNK